jgi:hypothetical protein
LNNSQLLRWHSWWPNVFVLIDSLHSSFFLFSFLFFSYMCNCCPSLFVTNLTNVQKTEGTLKLPITSFVCSQESCVFSVLTCEWHRGSIHWHMLWAD